MNNLENLNTSQEENEQSESERVLGSMPSFDEFRKSIERDTSSEGDILEAKLAEIMDQYDYSEALQGMLKEVVPKISEYYDDEETIIEVLRKCPIFMLETGEKTNKEINDYFGEEMNVPTFASGGASIVPCVDDDGNIEVKKGIIIKNGEASLMTLVHEICHQVSSVNKEPKLEPDGRVRIDIGLSSEYYEKDKDEKMNLTESRHNYLEEMVNAYDTEMIMKSIKGQEYVSSEYSGLRRMLYACPANVVKKLKQIRAQADPSEIIVSQDILEQTSQILDDYMNVPRNVVLSRKMSGGDDEKAREIRRDMNQKRFNQVVENLTAWGAVA